MLLDIDADIRCILRASESDMNSMTFMTKDYKCSGLLCFNKDLNIQDPSNKTNHLDVCDSTPRTSFLLAFASSIQGSRKGFGVALEENLTTWALNIVLYIRVQRSGG